MNNVLQLKGTFQHRKNSSKPGPPSLPKGTSVQAEHLATLLEQLERIEVFWKENSFINGALVSVYYKRVIAKSNRVSFLLNNVASMVPIRPKLMLNNIIYNVAETERLRTVIILNSIS